MAEDGLIVGGAGALGARAPSRAQEPVTRHRRTSDVAAVARFTWASSRDPQCKPMVKDRWDHSNDAGAERTVPPGVRLSGRSNGYPEMARVAKLAKRGRLKPCRSFGTMWVRIPPRARGALSI